MNHIHCFCSHLLLLFWSLYYYLLHTHTHRSLKVYGCRLHFHLIYMYITIQIVPHGKEIKYTLLVHCLDKTVCWRQTFVGFSFPFDFQLFLIFKIFILLHHQRKKEKEQKKGRNKIIHFSFFFQVKKIRKHLYGSKYYVVESITMKGKMKCHKIVIRLDRT